MALTKPLKTSQSGRSSPPHIYEDPDTLLDSGTDGVQADVKPAPQSRKKKVQFSDIIDAHNQMPQPPRPAPKPPVAANKNPTDKYQSRLTPGPSAEPQPLRSDIKPPVPPKRKNAPFSYDTPVKSQPSEPQKPLVPPKQRSPSSTAQGNETPSSARIQASESQTQRSEQKPPIPQKRQNQPSSSSSSSPTLVTIETPERYSELPQQNKRLSVSFIGAQKERPVPPALSGNPQDSSGADQVKPQPPISDRPTPVARNRQLSSSSSSICYDIPPTAQNQTSEPLISDRSTPVPGNSSSSNLYYDMLPTLQNQISEPRPPISDRPTPVARNRQLSSSSSSLCYDIPPTAQNQTSEAVPPPLPLPASNYYNESRHAYLRVIPDNANDKKSRRLEPHPQLQPTSELNNYDSIYALNTNDITELLKWLKTVSSQSANVISPIYGLGLEEEIRSFEEKATNLRKARRLYNLLMMKRKESLEQGIKSFQAICAQLEKMKKTNKAMGIAGGTTCAVGGVAAVVGIALAPVTMGTSLIVTAVGAGVAASAGGFGAHAFKTNKKMVNRSTVEELVNNYKSNVVDMEHCLAFIFTLMKELQRYKISQFYGAHPDAVRMAELSQNVFKNNMNTDGGISLFHLSGMTSEILLKAFSSQIDLYFTEKKGQKLKKSDKSKFLGAVNNLTKNLQAELDYLINMWETLC